MQSFQMGRYRARPAASPEEVTAALRLRSLAFHGNAERSDGDDFDPRCTHILIEEVQTGALAGCFRVLRLPCAGIGHSYSGQFYDLAALSGYDGHGLELGRFCIDPALNDPDILRVAWAALTRYVDAEGITLLFGCSSFKGTSPADFLDGLALLKARHLAPARWAPKPKAPEVFAFGTALTHKPDAKRAMRQMPPLLKTYLMMGGWVSDHAVIDRQMNTLHVFTGVEIAAIPETRKRLLRAVAGAAPNSPS